MDLDKNQQVIIDLFKAKVNNGWLEITINDVTESLKKKDFGSRRIIEKNLTILEVKQYLFKRIKGKTAFYSLMEVQKAAKEIIK